MERRDGKIIVTSVSPDGTLRSLNDQARKLQATLLAGGHVSAWQEIERDEPLSADDFDNWIADEAEEIGIDTSRPFLFAIEGEFRNARLHVINGACPLHARLKNKPIAENQQPYERDFNVIKGRLIGVFARDAVGKLTHPATSVHAHLIFESEAGDSLTGHLEQVGLGSGAILKLPKPESLKD